MDIPSPSALAQMDSRQLQILMNACAQDVMNNQGVNFLQAWPIAKTLYPSVWSALANLPPPDNSIPLPNTAPLPVASPENIESLGLARDVSPELFAVAWKAAGDKAPADDPEKVFSAVSGFYGNGNLTRDQAEAKTAAEHPRLKMLADSAKSARRLAEGRPQPGQGFKPAASGPDPNAGATQPGTQGANPFRAGALANTHGETVALGNSAEGTFLIGGGLHDVWLVK